jgi:PadR family transcriptional regulator, regulatory protein AphA
MSMAQETRLTTTAYALLGLLCTRPYSPYELAQQMKRDLHFCWPRAERAIYYEPKRLVALGLVSAEKEPTGRRPRTVYSITPDGRRAFTEWLELGAAAPPELECEALVRATFAHRGSKRALLEVLAELREHAVAMQRQIGEQAREYEQTGGRFPDQLHLIALGGRFLADYARMLEGWASWAEDEVRTWPSVASASEVPLDFAYDLFRELGSADEPSRPGPSTPARDRTSPRAG